MAVGRLEFLIGTWNTVGEVRASPTSPAVAINGTDSYELVLGGSFIEHRVDVMMGDVRTEAIELIGEYDNARGTYQMRSFGNDGGYAVMEGRIETNGSLVISGDKMRASLTRVVEGQKMEANWEMQNEDGKWVPWMDLVLTKA